MRELIGLIVGIYLTAAIVVFGGAAYGFISGEHGKYSSCEPSWGWAFYRAAVWPKAYLDDADKTQDLADWLVVRYAPFTTVCG